MQAGKAKSVDGLLDAAAPQTITHVERQISPAVIPRKNSQSNRSDRGAASQAGLMSVYRTLRVRGLDPTQTITEALKAYLTTGQLPPCLPDSLRVAEDLCAPNKTCHRGFESR